MSAVLLCDSSDRAPWLEARQAGIGASEIAAVFGLGFKTPLQLWALKSGHIAPDDLSGVGAVEWGNRLEASVIQAALDASGADLVPGKGGILFQHSDHPWMLATPDAVAIDDRGQFLIEAKTTRNAKAWEHGPPPHVVMQAQQQMAVMDLERCLVAVLIQGSDFRTHWVDRSESTIGAIVSQGGAFWDSVQQGIEPPAMADDGPVLFDLHPQEEEGATVDLGIRGQEWAEELAHLTEQEKRIGKRKKEINNKIKQEIGDAEIGIYPGGRWTYRQQNRAAYTVDAKTFRTLRHAATKEG